MKRRSLARCTLGRRCFALATASAMLAGCSPVEVLNTLAPDRLFAHGIAYGPDERQKLDLYRPVGPGPFPVAMFVYGGDWSSGHRSMYRFVGDALAGCGFLTVIPDYRLYPEIRYPVFLQDCARALAWTRREVDHYDGIDAAPCLLGHSAGAYNVAMLTLDRPWLAEQGLDPRRDIAGTVGLSGPYDFAIDTPMLRDLFGTAPDFRDTQPIAHVDGRAPPMLLLTGTDDHTVDPSNTRHLAARIRSAGGEVDTRLYKGVDHVEIIGAFAGPLRFLAPSLRDSVRFMRRRAVSDTTSGSGMPT